MRDVIYVVVKLQARAGKEEALRKLIEARVEPTRKEKGCLRYVLLQDRRNPAVISLQEEWETEADMNTHLALPAMQALFAQVPEFLGAPPEISQYKQVA
jgi:quinol monooxygenase YgiN